MVALSHSEVWRLELLSVWQLIRGSFNLSYIFQICIFGSVGLVDFQVKYETPKSINDNIVSNKEVSKCGSGC
jgi:hypothetical protein